MALRPAEPTARGRPTGRRRPGRGATRRADPPRARAPSPRSSGDRDGRPDLGLSAAGGIGPPSDPPTGALHGSPAVLATTALARGRRLRRRARLRADRGGDLRDRQGPVALTSRLTIAPPGRAPRRHGVPGAREERRTRRAYALAWASEPVDSTAAASALEGVSAQHRRTELPPVQGLPEGLRQGPAGAPSSPSPRASRPCSGTVSEGPEPGVSSHQSCTVVWMTQDGAPLAVALRKVVTANVPPLGIL